MGPSPYTAQNRPEPLCPGIYEGQGSRAGSSAVKNQASQSSRGLSLTGDPDKKPTVAGVNLSLQPGRCWEPGKVSRC